jgi:uncharacterized membrane protein
MPEKRTKRTTAPRKTAAKTAAPKKALAKPAAKAVLPKPAEPALPATTKPAQPRPSEKAPPAGEVCPRCGSSKFGPEERIRAEGNRTVRFTVLVCERGHTFAKPVRRTA